MRITLLFLLSICLNISLSAQEQSGYSDKDLSTYITISNSLQVYRMGIKVKADSLREAEGLSEVEFLEIVNRLRAGESYDEFKSEYPEAKRKAFEKTMSYRQYLREGMQMHLNKELTKVGWDRDYYEQLVANIAAIPDLQKRIIALSK